MAKLWVEANSCVTWPFSYPSLHLFLTHVHNARVFLHEKKSCHIKICQDIPEFNKILIFFQQKQNSGGQVPGNGVRAGVSFYFLKRNSRP